LQGDEPDPAALPDAPIGRVAVGRYVLVLGDRAGTEILPLANSQKPRALARAIARSHRKREASPGGAKQVEEDISQAPGKAEHAINLFTEIAQGRLDPVSIADEANALLDLMRRLDRDEQWDEVLSIARPIVALLALLARWVELLQALQVAVGAAEQLGNTGVEAWALHELGTLHLAGEDHSGADRLLGRARDLRKHAGSGREQARTDRNLQVLCQALRAKLHEHPFRHALAGMRRWPAMTLSIALALLVLGGVAGAEIDGSGHHTRSADDRQSIVRIKVAPAAPGVDEPVAFGATVEGVREHYRYAWQFGDHHRSAIASPTHTYKRPGIFTANVSVSSAGGKAIGRATRILDVHESVFRSSSPSASFSFEPSSPAAGAHVVFDATTSFDPDPGASITSYVWRFGDDKTGTGPTPTHAFADPGVYTTELTVTDTRGATGSTAHRVVVVPPTTTTSTKRPSSIRLACPRNPTPGEAVTIAGVLRPPAPNATITVTYTPPSGTPETETLPANADGAFQGAAMSPRQAGRWLVQSSWAGNAEYEPATSQTCVFLVELAPSTG
jgi:PKD repeat protein